MYRDDDEEDMNEREMTEAHKLYLEDGVDCVDGEVDDSNESSDDEYNPLEWLDYYYFYCELRDQMRR